MAMIKCVKTTWYQIERYPKNCNECPCFKQTPYSCHNERGTMGGCELGYMNGYDTRDFDGLKRFSSCNIENNPRVSINKADIYNK